MTSPSFECCFGDSSTTTVDSLKGLVPPPLVGVTGTVRRARPTGCPRWRRSSCCDIDAVRRGLGPRRVVSQAGAAADDAPTATWPTSSSWGSRDERSLRDAVVCHRTLCASAVCAMAHPFLSVGKAADRRRCCCRCRENPIATAHPGDHRDAPMAVSCVVDPGRPPGTAFERSCSKHH